jgi:hypothetical protein
MDMAGVWTTDVDNADQVAYSHFLAIFSLWIVALSG